eukprot:3106914-Prymnesium_polylepis.1
MTLSPLAPVHCRSCATTDNTSTSEAAVARLLLVVLVVDVLFLVLVADVLLLALVVDVLVLVRLVDVLLR